MIRPQLSLKAFIFRRILYCIPTIFGVIMINFLIIYSAPGDPVYRLVGEGADPEYYKMMRERLGLDKPLYEQLSIYLGNVIQGNLGYSFTFRMPVLDIITARVPLTILLMVTANASAAIIGITLGTISATKHNSISDTVLSILSSLGFAMPTAFLAIMSILLFSLYLPLFPSGGYVSLRGNLTGIFYVVDVLHHLFLPAMTLALIYTAMFARLTRGYMLDVLTKDFIVLARSKGLSERSVIYTHALRNVLSPVITIIGMKSGFMLAGTVLVETVFSWPGLGRLMYESILGRDYPVLMGMLVIISITVMAANLVTDVIYGVLDPRVRR